MKAVMFLNPVGVDEKILEDIKSRLIKENITPVMFKSNEDIKTSDFAIAFGGDGTIIHAAKLCSAYKKSVLGINGGRLGYTAGIEQDELELLKKLKLGEYFIDKRMMLEVTVSGENGEKKLYCANDAVVSRGSLSRIVDISLEVGENEILHTRSDGVIVSTPTGSTAYSLSAGGPILDPSVGGILITAVCPHSLYSRPIVLNEKETVKIKVKQTGDLEAYLTVDGETGIKLNQNDIVTVKKSNDFTVDFIRIKNESFMNILNKKFFAKG